MAPTSSSHAYSPTAKETPTPSPRRFHPQTIQPSRLQAKQSRRGRLRSPSHPQPCNKSLSPPRKSSTSPPQATQPIPEDPDHDSSPNPPSTPNASPKQPAPSQATNSSLPCCSTECFATSSRRGKSFRKCAPRLSSRPSAEVTINSATTCRFLASTARRLNP
jgi:hypothetical protein